MLTPINELIDTNGEARHFASVGGYGITYIGDIDDILCSDCVNGWTEEGIRENVKGGFIHWEGTPLTCEGCNAEIESEYGDPDEDEDDEEEDIGKVQHQLANARLEKIHEEAPHILGGIR